MDVRCSRCATEYEFDDALISERGTTVKCTNCGHQFKIYPSEGTAAAPERWVVRTVAGRELVYTSLRDLQRGIAEHQVGPNDLLSRGKQPPRPLGSIAELEPFFQARAKTGTGPVQPVKESGGTLLGVAPPPSPNAAPPIAAPHTQPAAVPMSAVPSAVASAPLTQEPPALSASLPAELAGIQPQQRARHGLPDSPTLRSDQGVRVDAQTVAEYAATLPQPAAPAFVPPPPPPIAAPVPPTPLEPERAEPLAWPGDPSSEPRPGYGRDSFHSYDEFHPELGMDAEPPRSARSRWIAGLVIAGVLGLLAVTVGRQYISRFAPIPESKTASDVRVQKFLLAGNQLLDENDFEGAKEQFDKAAAFGDKDPAVLSALARLETLRADVTWLRLRLLDPKNNDLVQATHRELGRRVGSARKAVDRAFGVAPEEPVVLRSRIDALRLSGEADKAREWLGPITRNASLPENAYVLAALDLSETNPVWSTVVDRLRTAASAERDPGRATAALIYALVRSGRVDEAHSEFSKLEARPKPHPLLEELRAFVNRHALVADPRVTDAGAAPAAVDPSTLPKLDTSQPAEETEKKGDFRSWLSQASNALQQGNLTHAQRLYNNVLDVQPNNTEALSGLADIARRKGDHASAGRLYDKVLGGNPNYLPALLASADQKWEAGDKKGAAALYRRVLEQAGAGSEYGARAASRLAQADAATEKATTTSGATPDAGGSAPPSNAPPGVDTTDLPEFR